MIRILRAGSCAREPLQSQSGFLTHARTRATTQWVNNCVGHYNHKYFILFIWYTVAIGLYNCLTLFLWAYPMREEDQDLLFDEFYLWANVGVSGIFGGLQIFFGVHHINLVRANSTTIELIGTRGRIKSKARQRTWDLGAKANMRQVASASLSSFLNKPSMISAWFCPPCILVPCTLNPKPASFCPPCTLNPKPASFCPPLYTLRSQACTLVSISSIWCPRIPLVDLRAARKSCWQVFGSRRITWALPCVQGCEGDGYSYPKRNGDAGAEAPV
jgi:hypothetical protein